MPVMNTGDFLALAARAANPIGPAKFFKDSAAFLFCAKAVHHLDHVNIGFHSSMVHRRSPVPKKKKPARELTNEEIASRVFGEKMKSQLKEIAKKGKK